jgi:hypothetical protein
MAVDRSHEGANTRERERLAALVVRAGAQLDREVGGGWTIGTALGHLAFWDRLSQVRVKELAAGGEPVVIPVAVMSALNEALVPQWQALSGKAAAAEALAAAEELDAAIAGLSDEALERYRASLAPGAVPRLIDRTSHRKEHIAQIEAALG